MEGKISKTCGMSGRHKVAVVVTPEGKIGSARLVGPLAGSREAWCVEAVVKTAVFPRFKGSPMRFTHLYLLRGSKSRVVTRPVPPPVVRRAPPPPPPTKDTSLPERLTPVQVKRGMKTTERRARRCATSANRFGNFSVAITVSPKGLVTRARVLGTYSATPIARCVARAAKTAWFPAFSGKPMSFRYLYLLQSN